MSKLSHEQKETDKRQTFTPAEVQQLVCHLEKHGPLFWLFAVRVSYEIGLRLGDICNLEWHCFREANRITVWTDKRDRRISVPIPEDLYVLVTTIPVADPQYLFRHEREINKDPARRPALSMQFKRLLAKLGIEGKSFHCLRHTCITRWAKEGKTLESIGKDVGHLHPETTKGYVH